MRETRQAQEKYTVFQYVEVNIRRISSGSGEWLPGEQVQEEGGVKLQIFILRLSVLFDFFSKCIFGKYKI